MASWLLLPVPLIPVLITLYRSSLMALFRRVCATVLKLPGRNMCVRRIHAYVFSECTHGQAESVLATFHQYANTHAVLSIGPEKGEFLDEVVRRKAPLRVLELGMHCGYSSVRILCLLPVSGKLFTVEMDPLAADKGEEIILVAGFKHKQFQVLSCSSHEAITGLASDLNEGQLDLVVMDHDPEQYLPDLLALQRHNLLSESSVVVLNGAQEPGAQTVLKYISARPQNYSVCQQFEDMLEIICHKDTDLHEEES
ncbi:transmembrane O-methyltransferase homolog [Trichomycterus rosablanca]|uniref:transmembrane O-methyltransferase homolog n=1 Tax=Trichomycterus rosablanca TaxID=2290929 RepID=UPI002F356E8B